jgi:hypothetical protein
MGNPEELIIFPLRLEKAGLPYMVTGGLAAALYGEPRVTRDIDLVLQITVSQAVQLPRIFDSPEFYCPPLEVIRIEITRVPHGHFNIIHSTTAIKADIYPVGVNPFERKAFARRQQINYLGQQLWLAPPDYVIAHKLDFYRQGGSEKHLRDIRAILTVSSQQIDRICLADNLTQLQLTELWLQIFSEHDLDSKEV